MYNENYVKFNVARLLKERGFDLECVGCYPTVNHEVTPFNKPVRNSNVGPQMYAVPTQQVARDWLEDEYGFFIEVSRSVNLNGGYHYSYCILKKDCSYLRRESGLFSSNSEAVDDALLYCLTK
jgi:hypothetical protein